MNGPGSFTDNPINWSFPAGRLFNIRIRVHLFFLLWIAFELLREVLAEQPQMGAAVVFLGLLFGIVLLHELGHCFGARSVGGDADEILMWPLGGLAMVSPPHNPLAHLVTTAAGPAVNLVICCLTGSIMLLGGLGNLITLNPFSLGFMPGSPFGEWGFSGWLVALWVINYLLLLFNLLPIFPLDGGRLLQAVLWQRKGYHQATLTATFIGMVGAVVIGLIGLATDQTIMVCIAVFGYLTCANDRRMLRHGMMEHLSEFGGFTTFGEEEEEREPTWLEKRQARRAARREQRAQAEEAQREEEIDRILQKVHDHGMSSLTPRERRTLQADTERRRTPR